VGRHSGRPADEAAPTIPNNIPAAQQAPQPVSQHGTHTMEAPAALPAPRPAEALPTQQAGEKKERRARKLGKAVLGLGKVTGKVVGGGALVAGTVGGTAEFADGVHNYVNMPSSFNGHSTLIEAAEFGDIKTAAIGLAMAGLSLVVTRKWWKHAKAGKAESTQPAPKAGVDGVTKMKPAANLAAPQVQAPAAPAQQPEQAPQQPQAEAAVDPTSTNLWTPPQPAFEAYPHDLSYQEEQEMLAAMYGPDPQQ